MYLEFYGLSEPPFSITPDPRFVFLSERHRDALAHLLFGIGQGGGGGFVLLTGEVGTGKTTLSRLLLEQLPDNTRVALVLNPRVSALELLETICEELQIDLNHNPPATHRSANQASDQDNSTPRTPPKHSSSTKVLIDALNTYLLDAYANGLRVVVVIDEAQNLSVDALEQVRLLTNLETDTQKLLQIVLLGQPELRTMLAREELRQLSQRITARFHLTPLEPQETGEYLRHRYRVAGGQRFPWTAKALRKIHSRSGGVPRLINIIAERTLLAGYARDMPVLDEQVVGTAADEALPARSYASARIPPWRWLAGAATMLALLLLIWLRWPTPTAAPAATASAASTNAPVTQPTSSTVVALDATGLAVRLRTEPASPRAAWQRLLQLWGLPASSITVDDAGSCTAVTDDVHCTAGNTTLDRLLALDRPMLLPLSSGDAQTWGVLLGADARRARIGLHSGVVDVERGALQSVWDGRYFALWRGPKALTQSLWPGATGPGVVWLRQRLDLPSEPARYDEALRQAVGAFQRARGLQEDRVAGPETLIALADNTTGPRLIRELR